MTNQWQNSRKLSSIFIFKANLKLTSPALFGSGEREGVSDITVLRDEESGYPLLSGSTVAGVIRNYLSKLNDISKNDAKILFGDIIQKDDKQEGNRDKEEKKISRQSYLIIDESIANKTQIVERRENVAINLKTRVAKDKHKFDYEVLAKGTIFPISMELLIPNDNTSETIQTSFLNCINGLLKGQIPIGAKTTRGLGTCMFTDWEVFAFDFQKDGLTPWLKYNTLNESTWRAKYPDKVKKPRTIEAFANIFGIDSFKPAEADQTKNIHLEAKFTLNSSLLIRSQDETIEDKKKAPETRHLHRKNISNSRNPFEPIISGTSLAGVLRHRAQKILRTQGKSEEKAKELIESLFGRPGVPESKANEKVPNDTRIPISYRGQKEDDDKNLPQASRFIVRECVIKQNPNTESELVQSRVAIDRFTGGAADNKLFTEQALFKAGGQSLTIDITIKNAKAEEFDLLILLLLDLWTGDLPIGSGANIGRGILRGESCTIRYDGKTWKNNTPYEDKKGSLVLIKE